MPAFRHQIISVNDPIIFNLNHISSYAKEGNITRWSVVVGIIELHEIKQNGRFWITCKISEIVNMYW